LKRTLTGLRCRLLAALLTTLLPLSGHAQQSAAFSEQAEVQAFIVDMHKQHGFDISALTSQFASIHSNATVLRLIRPPARPSKQRSWQSYRQRFVNGPREAGGLRFWEENGALLQRAEAIYGVPAEIIVAIIGVETSYGQNTGSFSVLEALASLAFDYPPRAEFFRSELENFLLLAAKTATTRSPSRVPTPAPWASRSSCPAASATTRWTSMATVVLTCATAPPTPSAAWLATCSSMVGRKALRWPCRHASTATPQR
jgi:membrane-bound lytic murein transglycosylase B